MKNKKLKRTLLVLLTISFIAFVVDFFAIEVYMLVKHNLVPNWPLIFVFQVPLFLISAVILHKQMANPENQNKISQIYIYLMTIRVFLCLAFLFPWLINRDETSYPMVGQFFFIFFILLIAEISLLVRDLNHSIQKIEEEE